MYFYGQTVKLIINLKSKRPKHFSFQSTCACIYTTLQYRILKKSFDMLEVDETSPSESASAIIVCDVVKKL